MKYIKTFPMLLLLATGSSWAQSKSDDATLLMDMVYSGGEWRAKPRVVLPCAGPSKPDSIASNRSMYRLIDEGGRTLYQHYMGNPRVILVEDPRKEPRLLEETKFTLRVPMNRGKTDSLEQVAAFEFYENFDAQRGEKDVKPSVRVPLQKSLGRLTDAGAEQSDCLPKAPNLGELPPLDMKPGDALSVDEATRLLADNPQALIKLGIKQGVKPAQLKQLIAENKANLATYGLTEKRAYKLLEEYTRAFRASK